MKVELTDEERRELESLGRSHRTAQALARRARIVLAAAEGLANKEIAAKLKRIEAAVGMWHHPLELAFHVRGGRLCPLSTESGVPSA